MKSDSGSAPAVERPTPLDVEEVTEKVAKALASRDMFTVRAELNKLGYIDIERSAVYLISIQHAEFVVNE